MRFDWFLPYLRKSTPGRDDRSTGAVRRMAARILPASWFSSRDTKLRGRIRKVLRWLGPVWYSSPLRRCIQTLCFVLFLWQFLWVCWPYNARPAWQSNGWTPTKFDLGTQLVEIEREQRLEQQLSSGDRVYLRDDSEESALLEEADAAVPFLVRSVRDNSIQLILAADGDLSSLELLSLTIGPISVHPSDPESWPSHYADNLVAKESIAAELFLSIDPLVSLSTGIASRAWIWSLVSAGIILAVCVFIPRGFCGYLCPLGTLIDLFDGLVGSRVTLFRVSGDGWWVHIKYYMLLGVLVAASFGVLLSGFVAAIPVITRGLLFVVAPFQNGAANGWHQVPPLHWGHVLSISLFIGVLCLGLLRPRFWCKYLCPSGAVFSLGNLLRVTERKVESSCIHCNKCVEICPFDAIKPDFTTRTTDCTFCQTCGGVCPTQAITFVGRWATLDLKAVYEPPTHETALGRRGFLSAGIGVASSLAAGTVAALTTRSFGADLDSPGSLRLVRPPGSVPEREFLQMCIRCGECFKACPSDVLQPLGFQQGLEGLWTPYVNADWAGCASSCNGCGQVCPTGAIRALPLEEKRHARMGLAFLNLQTCLPHAGKEACQLCVDECTSAGYNAIEFTQVGTEVDDAGQPIEGTGFLAPLMIDDKCVGCGLCQTRCYGINVSQTKLLVESAIVIKAGTGHEDRLMSGSYVQLRGV
ncbi:MAG: 4Fe-4S binding protein [Planctomycetaceae bacterium]